MIIIYIYQHKWYITLTCFTLLVLLDSYYHFYPLYQTLNDRKQDAHTLFTSHQTHVAQSSTNAANKNHHDAVQLVPYHSNEWLIQLTKKMNALSIQINKLEKKENSQINQADVSLWAITLSGDAYSLFSLLQDIYHDFPWLSIKEPIFTMKQDSEDIDVTMQLIALNHRPKLAPIFNKNRLPLQSSTGLPFCQSMHASRMLHDAPKLARVNYIQYKNTRVML